MAFHVSTLRTHNQDDRPHLAKKQLIGNDVVAIIFQVLVYFSWEWKFCSQRNFLEDLWQSFVNNFHQEEEVTFHPEMVASNFLHAILVVRPTPEGYKIAMVTRWEQPPTPPSPREDVPDFGPQLSGDTAHTANRGLRWVRWLPRATKLTQSYSLLANGNLLHILN